MKRMIRFLLILAGIGLSVLTFAGFLGEAHWLLDLTSHFKMQYLLGLLIVFVLGLLMFKTRWRVILLLPALLFNLGAIAPFFMPAENPTGIGNESAPLRVTAINTYANNRTPQAVADYILEVEPHIVMISEISPAVYTQFTAALRTAYPYHQLEVGNIRWPHFNIAIFSQLPLDAITIEQTGTRRPHPAIRADLTWQDQPITLIGIHVNPPLSGRETAFRDSEFDTLRTLSDTIDRPLVMLGDFNASPWSYQFQLFAESGLTHAALGGHGIQPTWWRPMLGVPLDHVMTSAEWQTTSYTVGRDIGSDHYPVTADLHLKNLP